MASHISPAQFVRLVESEITNENGVLRLRTDLGQDAYSPCMMVVNAQTFLSAIADAPPRATATLGNLERAFVGRVFEAMDVRSSERAQIVAGRKVLDEQDVPRLHHLRVTLELAGLVRKRKGRFHLTKAGAALAIPERIGDLFGVVFRAFFGKLNLGYLSALLPEDAVMQQGIATTLWAMRQWEGPFTATELAERVPTDDDVWVGDRDDFFPYELMRAWALYAYVMAPLRDFGLIAPAEDLAPLSVAALISVPWSVTPLFDELIGFDLGPEEPDSDTDGPGFVPSESVSARDAIERFWEHRPAPDAEAADIERMLVDGWIAFLDRSGPETLDEWDGAVFDKATRDDGLSFSQYFGPDGAMRAADPFIEAVRSGARPGEEVVVVLAASLISEFALWCGATGLVSHVDVVECLQRTDALVTELAPELKANVGYIGDEMIVRLKITLRDVRPAVWRRVEVWDDVTMGELHSVINAVMGWEECHLHRFTVGERSIGYPDDFGFPGEEDEDEESVMLYEILDQGVKRFKYEYDFGDGWRHDVIVENIGEPADETDYPRCIAGANACPPEDVGGTSGYAGFLAAMKNPRAKDPEGFRHWYGGPFDPTAFDLGRADLNARRRLEEWRAGGYDR
ncbi:MAG: plasmid pRiA4b ORF-3 family protein [Actinomycetota bacterium]|nr:plasmid pRiA4b ORF-3 family protein [Actinomycetota bacterium]